LISRFDTSPLSVFALEFTPESSVSMNRMVFA
jgi:hypothetical protein